jgi:hypothetical protein
MIVAALKSAARYVNAIRRLDTGLAIVSGACREMVAIPASITIKKSSHIPNPGGKLTPFLNRDRYNRLAIGMAARMKI